MLPLQALPSLRVDRRNLGSLDEHLESFIARIEDHAPPAHRDSYIAASRWIAEQIATVQGIAPERFGLLHQGSLSQSWLAMSLNAIANSRIGPGDAIANCWICMRCESGTQLPETLLHAHAPIAIHTDYPLFPCFTASHRPARQPPTVVYRKLALLTGDGGQIPATIPFNRSLMALLSPPALFEEMLAEPGTHTASHLCGNWRCINPTHIADETLIANNSRLYCVNGFAAACHHEPVCVWRDFVTGLPMPCRDAGVLCQCGNDCYRPRIPPLEL